MSPLTVLMVDDRPENLLALRATLEQPSYRLLEATSGEQALQIALREDIDVILLDVVMPGMDGFEVAASLKQIQRTAHIPIIFLTALATELQQLSRAHDIGGVDYLVKPLEPELVRRRVGVFAELVRHRREAEEKSKREFEVRLAQLRLASDRRYRLFVEGIENAMAWTLDGDGRISFVSAQAPRLLGHDIVELSRRRFLEHVHADDRAMVAEQFARVVDMNGDVRFTHRMITADARVIWFVTCVTCVQHDGVPELHGVSTDITETKRSEERQRLVLDVARLLGESLDVEAALPAVARRLLPTLGDWCFIDVAGRARLHADDELGGDGAPDGEADERVLLGHDTWSADGERAADANGTKASAPDDAARDVAVRCIAAAHRDTARSLDQLLARRSVPSTAGVGRVFLSGEHAHVARVDGAPDAAQQFGVDARVVEALGAEAYLSVPVALRGKTIAVITLVATTRRRFTDEDIAVMTNVSARVALALDGAWQYRAARRAIRAREDLLAVVSHDLRSPLTTISVGADGVLTQLKAAPSAPGRDPLPVLQSIVRAAHSMERLIGDLLDVAEIDSGQLRIEHGRADAASLVEEVIEQMRQRAAKKQLQLDMRVERHLAISCDRQRVVQVLANLVTNALKFTPAGGRVVAAVERDGDAARFAVSDTGPGIDDGDLKRIWRRYWRADRTGGGGVGLGLSIAKSLVVAHGGSIWAESKRGVGTTFYFTIPRVDGAAPRTS